jgi:non-canonical (house-cleaning) NTP pyrophosphatase
VQSGLDEKNEITVNTIRFIDAQLGNVIDSLKATEDLCCKTFRLSNKIVDLSFEGKALFDKLERLDNEKNISENEIGLLYLSSRAI